MGTAAPMIFTGAMGAAQYSAQGKIGKQSLLQMRNRNRFDEDIWWGQGNAQPSEKNDAFWWAAHMADTEDDFNKKVALQGVFMPSYNSEDEEPSTQYFNNHGGAYA